MFQLLIIKERRKIMATFLEKVKEVKLTELKDVIKSLNSLEVIEEKIRTVGVTKEDMITKFSLEVERLSEVNIDLPEDISGFYNAFWGDIEDTVEIVVSREKSSIKKKEKTSDKKAPKKKEKVKKKKEEKKESSKKIEPVSHKKEKKDKPLYDDFGFVKGTKNSLFVSSIKKKPKTMKQIKEELWNDKQSTFYDVFNKLKEKGIVDYDENKRMFVTAPSPKGDGFQE